MVEPGQATDENMPPTHCMLDTQGYKHALKICNAYCFYMAAMVRQTRLCVTFIVNCLS